MKFNINYKLFAVTSFSMMALFLSTTEAATYTVFTWGDGNPDGTSATAAGVKDLPAQPTAANTPSSLTYDGSSNTRGQAQTSNSTAPPSPTNMTMTITALNYVNSGLTRYLINARNSTAGSTGGVPTYGYQTTTSEFGTIVPGATSEPELDLGLIAGGSYKLEFDFATPVSNPSFLLMDIDNATSDTITNVSAFGVGGVSYPSLSVPSGSLIRYTGSGASLVVDTPAGTPNSPDDQGFGNAFYEWSGSGITHLELTYTMTSNTSIRMSNIYAGFDPVDGNGLGYTTVVVPEPTTAALAGLFGLLGFSRRRRA